MRVSIQFTGDILCQACQTTACQTADGPDYTPVLAAIRDRLADCDYLVGNLETPVAGAALGYTDRLYQFNTPFSLLEMLKSYGFHLLSTANNHCMDRGLPGLLRTLDHLDRAGIAHTGTYRSRQERATPFIRELGGMRFGFLSYTYGTNAFFHHCYLPPENDWAVNLLQPEEERPGAINLMDRPQVAPLVQQLYEADHPLFHRHIAPYLCRLEGDIRALRRAGAEFVIMLLHCGGQHDPAPDAYTQWMVRWLDRQGVDLIIGHHQHILHPYARLEHAHVAYCLGNLTDTPNSNPNGRGLGEEYSILLRLSFERRAGSVRLCGGDFVPVKSVLDHRGRSVVREVSALLDQASSPEERRLLLRDLSHFVHLVRGTDPVTPVAPAPCYPLP